MKPSVQTLLSAVVDYAGLFPPAQLGLTQAIRNYEQDRASSHSSMLGRFVLPASRVTELSEQLVQSSSTKPWPLSVVLSGDVESVVEQLQALPSLPTSPHLAVAALEFPHLSPEAIQSLLAQLPTGIDAFFEIPFTDPTPHLKVLKGTGAFAKIRTGGIKAEAFPSVAQLGQFILACADTQVPFKATAGLHHALPGHYRLTYEADSPTAAMHGFLNVAIASTLAYSQTITLEELSEILKESRASGFGFETDGVRWGDRHLSLSKIKTTRRDFFRGFGSCSFQEPIHDLMELQLLEASPVPS